MNIYHAIPAYTYKITCKPTGQFYYGFRCKNMSLNRHPHEDLWLYYFTSSNLVKELINRYGKDAFVAEILFTSYIKEEAYLEEQQLIKGAWGDPLLLNKRVHLLGDTGVLFMSTTASAKKVAETRRKNGSHKSGALKGAITREINGTNKQAAEKMMKTKKERGTDKIAIEKMIKTKKERGSAKIGAVKVAEIRKNNGTYITGTAKMLKTKADNGIFEIAAQKMIKTKTENGTFYSASAKAIQTMRIDDTLKDRQRKIAENRKINGTDKIGAAKRAEKLAKSYIVIQPDGISYTIKNLNKFCRENNLDNREMCKICKTGYKHRGWKCTRVEV